MTKPLLGGHMYLPEGDGNPIPDYWQYIRFDVIDILYITPFSVRQDFTFGLTPNTNETARFEWVIQQARTQNPNIKIIASQFYSDGLNYAVLTTEASRTTYTDSVRDFIQSYKDKVVQLPSGPEISLRVDGYDVDYEWLTEVEPGNGNLQTYAPEIFHEIRTKLDALGDASPFYVSITPATTLCLDNDLTAPALDYINMQNYDGGTFTLPDDYLSAIPNLKVSQLVWGITTEMPWKCVAESMEDAITQSKSQTKQGVMSGNLWAWRLNSNDWVFENMVQVALYKTLYGIQDPTLIDLVNKGWSTGGRATQNGPDPPVSPYTEQDWLAANMYR